MCSEAKLLGKARELFKDHRYVFLICSSTNLDSLASFYHAAASYGMGMYGNFYVYSQLKTFRETAGRAAPFYDFKYAYEVRFDFVLPGKFLRQKIFHTCNSVAQFSHHSRQVIECQLVFFHIKTLLIV